MVEYERLSLRLQLATLDVMVLSLAPAQNRSPNDQALHEDRIGVMNHELAILTKAVRTALGEDAELDDELKTMGRAIGDTRASTFGPLAATRQLPATHDG